LIFHSKDISGSYLSIGVCLQLSLLKINLALSNLLSNAYNYQLKHKVTPYDR
jgi:hypothetical protein